MATTKFYLDTRAVREGDPAPLKLAISRKGTRTFLSLNVYITKDQWDEKTEKVVKHPSRVAINNYINLKKSTVDMMILRLTSTGEIGGMTATDLKNLAIKESSTSEEKIEKQSFYDTFLSHAESRKKAKTKNVYQHTMRRIQAFCKDFKGLSFEDITVDWLMRFDNFLSETSPSQNARNIHFRNIRTVFNRAIDEGLTSLYPFRRFKIRHVATSKRSISADQLRKFFNLDVEDEEREYMDMFKLIFYLIGINVVDLCALKDIKDGRIEFHRAKTNRLYSIKVEPEALEIIEKYRGKDYLLYISDRYKLHSSYLRKMNKSLQEIGGIVETLRGKLTLPPMFPEITTYWARHTWATIAASLDIPRDTIAHALGHGNNTVTDIYIDFDRSKVDDANRRVIDWVLYGKK